MGNEIEQGTEAAPETDQSTEAASADYAEKIAQAWSLDDETAEYEARPMVDAMDAYCPQFFGR
jgi:hypothetical protein